MFWSYYKTFKKVCTLAPSQALHKDINLGHVNLSTIKPFHMKKFYMPSIIII